MNKEKVLFVCVHNSARSQIAEALLNTLGKDKFVAESAGLSPGKLNPLVVEVLQNEEGIDISDKETQSVFDLYKQGKKYHHVITVCSQEAAEKCPIFPGVVKRLNWFFDDPSKLSGDHHEKIIAVTKIKDQIKEKIIAFISSH